MIDIVRWDPLRDLMAMRSDLDRLAGRLGSASAGPAGAPWSPVSDVFETDDAIVITAELPGVKDSDVEIFVDEGVLTLRGERRLEDEVQEARYSRIERSYGGFERSFRLPAGVKKDDISAGVAYGVLRVTIPKPVPSEPVKIRVDAG